MSLAQHLTATEGVDRAELQDEEFPFWNPFTPLLQPQPDPNEGNEPGLHPSLDAEDDDDFLDDDDAQSKAAAGTWRRLSFDAFAPPDASAQAPVDPTPHVAAYKISTPRRIAQVAFSIVACWFAAGTVFGFASLKPILIAEGVYRDQCSVDEIAAFADDGYVEPCPEQDLRLNLFFIAASITCNTSSLLAGSVLDRYGRRVCYTFSSIFLAIGSILMGYAFRIPEFDGYLVANIFLALGGTFLFVPSYQMANAFPKYSGIIVAIITGAFDASAAIYLFYRWVWEATNGAFTPAHFFFLYLIVPVCLLIGEYTLMPAGAYHTTPELEQKIEKAQNPMRDIHDSDDDLSENELHRVRSLRSERRRDKIDRIEEIFGSAEEREERAHQVEEQHVASGIWGVLHGLPAHRQMMTPWFILILLLTVLQMLRMNYFIATIRAQYRYMLGSDDPAEAINHFFDAALPIGGIAATPFIGLLLNNMSVGFMTAVLTVYIALIGVLNCLPYEWAGYATVVFFVLFRPLYYSAVSDYATKVFGFATFGRIYGMLTCISGIVNFSQSGIDALTHGPLHGDPTPINVAFAVLGSAIGLLLTVYVYHQAHKYEVEQSKPEMSDPQRLPLIRETTAEYGTVPGRDASHLV